MIMSLVSTTSCDHNNIGKRLVYQSTADIQGSKLYGKLARVTHAYQLHAGIQFTPACVTVPFLLLWPLLHGKLVPGSMFV